jgi:predicted transcriptional regulator
MLTKSTKLPLPPALTEQLEQTAERLGTTPASIARLALSEWLRRHVPPAVPASPPR